MELSPCAQLMGPESVLGLESMGLPRLDQSQSQVVISRFAQSDLPPLAPVTAAKVLQWSEAFP
jgi:hypothetical protein